MDFVVDRAQEALRCVGRRGRAPGTQPVDIVRSEPPRCSVGACLRRSGSTSLVIHRRRTQGATLHPALLGVLCVMHAPSHAKSAKGAKDCKGKNRGSGPNVLRSSWRSWRAWRDERVVSHVGRKEREERGRRREPSSRRYTRLSSASSAISAVAGRRYVRRPRSARPLCTTRSFR